MNNDYFRDSWYFDAGGGPETGMPIGVALSFPKDRDLNVQGRNDFTVQKK